MKFRLIQLSGKIGPSVVFLLMAISTESFARQGGLDSWVESLKASGRLSAERAFKLQGLGESERIRVLALAAAEADAYGQMLTLEFDGRVAQGLDLETISRTSEVYAELQALYFLKHETVSALIEEFRNKAHSSSRYSCDRSLLELEIDFFIDQARASILRRHPRKAYAVMALADLREALFNGGAAVGKCRGKESKERQKARFSETVRAARDIPKGEFPPYRAFQPKETEVGLSMEDLIRAQALAAREDLTASGGKALYPDVGENGNTFGTTFPVGTWALTFDDGPLSPYTEQVLENLATHGVSATFFVLSQQITREDCHDVGSEIMEDRPEVIYPELVQREASDGHAVGSHSYYHSQFLKDSDAQRSCEVVTASDRLRDVIGSRPEFFRLPYGQGVSVSAVRQWIADAGMIHVHWNVDTLDWQDKDPASIIARTLAQMRTSRRGIILFHDIHPQSVAASEGIMVALQNPENGWEAVTLPEIVERLNVPPIDEPAKNLTPL